MLRNGWIVCLFGLALLLAACSSNTPVTIIIDNEPTVTPAPVVLARPRYTLSYPKSAFIFKNYEELPFSLIREMCWNEVQGFCDEQFRGTKTPFIIYELTDWLAQMEGEIYQIGKECYWQMYRPQHGTDGKPHVQEHYWISCP